MSQYSIVRKLTEQIAEPLNIEDYIVQTHPDASPVNWHLAHTSWFFEKNILEPYLPNYTPHPHYNYLFNSYYNSLGERQPKNWRGMCCHPTVKEVYEYRRKVDAGMSELLDREDLQSLIEIGLNHEQQHQELMLTDLKTLLQFNITHPPYLTRAPQTSPVVPFQWIPVEKGLYRIGHDGADFCYDNEKARHKVYLDDFCIANRLVTNAEYLSFVRNKGYSRPEFWLSEGWEIKEKEGWKGPMYWQGKGLEQHLTFRGVQRLDPNEPVQHISYHEAYAYAKWRGFRLPTEAEWEVACEKCLGELPTTKTGETLDTWTLHPIASSNDFIGNLWEWTSSQYDAYPGYKPFSGALAEYNGKFMCNTFVLRGGSYATPASHIRPTYRNFWKADARFQFTGIRLAKDPS